MADNTKESGDGSFIKTTLKCDPLIVLEYPGVVKNVPKMLETLGGESKLSNEFNNDCSTISLNFQPDNPFCKAIHGAASRSTSLLMKVKRRYRRSKDAEDGAPTMTPTSASSSSRRGETPSCSASSLSSSSTSSGAGAGKPSPGSESGSEYSAEILGLIGQKYDFTYMNDFQYLPYAQNTDGHRENLIEGIVPAAGEDISYIDRDISAFMLPATFSRFEKPSAYNYKRDVKVRDRQRVEPEFRAKLIEHGRNKRYNFAIIITSMENMEVPMEPNPGAVDQMDLQKSEEASHSLEEVRKLFEKRPLWSRNALRCNIEISPSLIKGILCVLAYYFQQGPWRGLWCRMGYDPRTDPEARKYQLLDFRIRKELTDKKLKLLLKKKRMSLFPHQQLSRYKRVNPTPIITSAANQESNVDETNDSYYIMRRGLLPAYHQMFYQLCDLHDDELQAIINNPRWLKSKPNSKTGYYDAEMFRVLRDALTQMIKDTVLSVNTSEEKNDDEAKMDESSTSTVMENRAEEEDEEEDDLEDFDKDDDDEEEEEEEDEENGRGDDGGTGAREAEEPKDGGEESESENEMETEMLEFLGADMEPS